MYIKLLGKNPPTLDSIKGKCLDEIEDVDYIDVMSEDEYADKSFCIYDDFNQEIGYVEACLAREKAGIQIVRMKTNKDINEQEEILRGVINSIFDYTKMNQYVLECSVYAPGSGIDYSILDHMGFVGCNGLGSEYYFHFNPEYLNLVDMAAYDENTKEYLMKKYNSYQRKKAHQISQVKNNIDTYVLLLNDENKESERIRIQESLKFYQEALDNLENTKSTKRKGKI